MYKDKEDFIKKVIAGTYEVLDLAKYDIKIAEEVVERVKIFLSEDRITDVDLINSHYAYVSILLNAVEEWETVEENLEPIIKEILDKTYLDREAMIIENEIIKVLVNDFDKDKKTATKLVEKVNVRKEIDGYSLLLHFSPLDWALSILTRNNEVEALSKVM